MVRIYKSWCRFINRGADLYIMLLIYKSYYGMLFVSKFPPFKILQQLFQLTTPCRDMINYTTTL